MSISDIAEAALGSNWPPRLAKILNVTLRSVYRWSNGERDPGPERTNWLLRYANLVGPQDIFICDQDDGSKVAFGSKNPAFVAIIKNRTITEFYFIDPPPFENREAADKIKREIMAKI